MKYIKFLFLQLALLPLALSAQTEWTPPRSAGDSLVNDYSRILTAEQRDSLERTLEQFSVKTSNQIVVVITPTLHGDEIKAVGQRIGETWGVGQEKFNNGLVIIIKSKTKEEPEGDVAIMTGYGLEGAFPDVFCGQIIDEKMVPPLIEGDYYGAITGALEIIMPVAAGEYSYEQYLEDDRISSAIAYFFTFLIFGGVAFLMYRSFKKASKYTGGSGGYSSSDSDWHSSSSSDWDSSSSSDYGGYGGGHFGGGGASRKF